MDDVLGFLFVVLALALYVAAVTAYFFFIVPILTVVAIIIAFFIILFQYGETFTKYVLQMPRKAEGAEPAIKQYFFAAGWRELRVLTDETYRLFMILVRELGRSNAALRKKGDTAIFEPIIAGNYVALGAGTAGGVVVLGCITLIHAAFLSLCYVACAAAAVGLRAIEWLWMLVRRITVVCPHEDCHLPIALPIYRCASCGAKHAALLPSSYGITRRRCRCGKFLPTLFLFGRNRVPAFCPHPSCGKQLSAVIGTLRNIHIPIVGGPSAGKTAFLAASMLEIKRRRDVEVSFPDHAGQQYFFDVTARFQRGVPVMKTVAGSTSAFLVRMRDQTNHESLFYLYDAAGELYAGSPDLQRQNYFGHSDAIALLIDPFSLDQVRVDRAAEIASVESVLHVSPESPLRVYERMVVTLREQFAGRSRIPLRLAMILTKIDAIGMDGELAALERAIPATERDGTDSRQWSVREWLCRRGEGNLVRSAERDFASVGYFACSAFGRLPSDTDGMPFQPSGVVLPIEWMATHTGVRVSSQP